MAERLGTEVVVGPNGTRVDILFYDDGGLKFRVPERGPMAVTQAWLPGRGQDVMVRLVPAFFRRRVQR